MQPHPPAPGSIVIGIVTRLSPLQALVSINVVDDIPLPAGEEFAGVIRIQDVRATEKDRVKIGDCFRGGDVVRSQVVCYSKKSKDRLLNVKYRYPSEIHVVILLRRPAMISESFSPLVKLVRIIADHNQSLLMMINRSYTRACILAGNEMPKDWKYREKEMC